MTIKPSLAEVEAFLFRHQALIVHFSGTPKGVGPGGHLFPADLQHVHAGRAMGGVSCSIVTPRDRFQGEWRHATGTVGLVLHLVAPESLVAVSPGDAGSSVDAHGIRWAPDADIDGAALERSLTERGERYNEWVVRDFRVLGLFVAMHATVTKRVKLQVSPDAAAWMGEADTLSEEPIALHEIVEALPSLPVYSFQQGGVVELRDGLWVGANHRDLVRP